jgi:hypothetical protein
MHHVSQRRPLYSFIGPATRMLYRYPDLNGSSSGPNLWAVLRIRIFIPDPDFFRFLAVEKRSLVAFSEIYHFSVVYRYSSF